ncbi:uncharacterized protein LOC129733877 [Wyeomyia smithii]|uniref:uncharacterized protein LOC129733877 n=1 Tax=Wyeomyia smithii TaxID=174621 RepID=UPI0024681F34|nr:uncharacterized protein LOC129733877 [Wyeomyia smithii]
MDVEFDMQYKSLLVHHLNRDELEYELIVRGIDFTDNEARTVISRRLRNRIKADREKNTSNFDFGRLGTSVDEEIKVIDGKVKEIKELLTKRGSVEVTRESLKTRLVHCFARVIRASEEAEEEEDLVDLDSLQAEIRSTYNVHFSLLSTLGQADLARQISQSMSNLAIDSRVEQDKQPSNSSSQEDINDFRTPGRHLKRSLKSIEMNTEKPNLPNYWYPFPMPYNAYPWPFEPSQMQKWAAQKILNFSSADNVSKQTVPVRNPVEKVGRNPAKIDKHSCLPKKSYNQTRDMSEESGESESGWSSDQSHWKPRKKKHNHFYRRESPIRFKRGKRRPVSEWKLKYDGSDNGQSLMKFLKEVEFYARSENTSDRELFRSAIHLFSGSAKSWFMAGFENDDFGSWNELKEELKREFLSPDHDQSSESRAVARKQGPREKFQDFFMDIQKYFNSLTKPMTERKKFDIVFRNMRADYKGYAVSTNIDNLVDLKHLGRRLDATYWFKYQTPASEGQPRVKPAQVNEVYTGTKHKNALPNGNEQFKTRNFYNSHGRGGTDQGNKRARETQQENFKEREPDSQRGLDAILERYQVPRDGVCFNCRLPGHHARECNKPRHKYCQACGFHDVDSECCPYCEKNAHKTAPEGRPVSYL